MKSRNAKVSVAWIPIFSACFFLIGLVFSNRCVFKFVDFEIVCFSSCSDVAMD